MALFLRLPEAAFFPKLPHKVLGLGVCGRSWSGRVCLCFWSLVVCVSVFEYFLKKGSGLNS